MNVRETLSVIKSTVYTQSADQTLAFKCKWTLAQI